LLYFTCKWKSKEKNNKEVMMKMPFELLAPYLRPSLYLDPGSGSFLIQLLLAALLGGAFAIKIYWKKIKALFSGKKAEIPPLTDSENADPVTPEDPAGSDKNDK
jgi:hypothetical protein